MCTAFIEAPLQVQWQISPALDLLPLATGLTLLLSTTESIPPDQRLSANRTLIRGGQMQLASNQATELGESSGSDDSGGQTYFSESRCD